MNARLWNTFVSQTQTQKHFYQRVDAAKAQTLCQVATQVNAQESSCFKRSKAGDQDLKQMVTDHRRFFEQDGLEVIDTYLRRRGFESRFASMPAAPRPEGEMDPQSWRRL